MMRVLLADDEPVIVKGLKKLVSWDQFGMQIAGEAYDGDELLHLLDASPPDLVICDINMPKHTGIDVIKYISDRKLSTKVIFISAYQKFSYALDAMKYGAVDYLVKPIDRAELERVLAKTVSAIRDLAEEERMKGKLLHYEKKNHHDSIVGLLDRCLDGLQTPSDLSQTSGLGLESSCLTVCLIEIDKIENESKRWHKRELMLIEFALDNVIREIIAERYNGYAFPKRDRYVVLMHAESGRAGAAARDIQQHVNELLKLDISIGIGRSVRHPSQLHLSYQEAQAALRNKYFLGINQIITDPVHAMEENVEQQYYEQRERFIQDMIFSRYDNAYAGLAQWMPTVKALAAGSKELAVSTCFSTLTLLLQELKKAYIETSMETADNHALLEKLKSYCTFAELASGMKELIHSIRESIEAHTGNRELLQLNQVKAHIDDHYAEQLSLKTLAGMIYMNPYYFSSFFKKHTGQNFKSYLTKLRMKHAMRLLLHSDLLVYEIAERVGYQNTRQFSDMFKKEYGKAPHQFRS